MVVKLSSVRKGKSTSWYSGHSCCEIENLGEKASLRDGSSSDGIRPLSPCCAVHTHAINVLF